MSLRHAGDHWVIFRLAVYLSCIVLTPESAAAALRLGVCL